MGSITSKRPNEQIQSFSFENLEKSLLIIVFFRLEKPLYSLEGDGYSTKIVVNSITRFRLRVVSSSVPFSHSNIFDHFSISILDPFGHRIVVQRRLLSTDLLELTYQPMSIGSHQLYIIYQDKIDQQLTIDVINDESNISSCLKTFGPGLRNPVVGLPTEFYVLLGSSTLKTIAQDHLQFSLKPSFQAEIDYEQQLATVRFQPVEDGECPIHILENNRDINNSPFMARFRTVTLQSIPPRVKVVGLPKKLVLRRPVEFQVNQNIDFHLKSRILFE